MARESNVNVRSERNPSNRDAESRSRPFTSVLLTALIVVPVFCFLLRLIIAFGGDSLKWLIVWLSLLLFGTLLPGIAIGVGYRVTKRTPFVIWHVAITVHLFAIAVSLSVLPGWNHVSAGHHWWDDLAAWMKNVFYLPGWVVVIYLFGAACVALSWLLYRIDAFRAATGAQETADKSGLADLVKWPKGARIKPGTIEADDFAVTAEVEHDGIPIKEIRSSVEALEEHPGVIRGRSTVIGADHGGRSTIRIVHTDPHSEWRVWPGLSHPGGPYHAPIRTSYYSTGETQWYSFVRTPEGFRSPMAKNFASPNGTFKGSQGATGSGKSGGAAIELAEVFSRSDVQVVYVDTAKLLQNAGWCLDFVSLAAASRAANGALFEGLRRLGEYRSRVLGEAGVRDFDADAVALTGMSWIHLFADEFDVAKQGANMNWLATKGRSLGFRFSFTLPRATGENMDTNIRGAVGMWEQYGITQDYDKGFVLSDETIAAGANPAMFGVSIPGAHYLDRAPGIPQSMWAIDCRNYKTRQDYGDLRRAVEAARATFTPMTFTPGELEALGDVAHLCKPSVIRTGHIGQDEPPDDPTPTREVATPAAPAAAIEKGTPVDLLRKKFDTSDLVIDPATRALLDDIEDIDLTDEEREYGPINPREPLGDPSPETDEASELPDVKPVPPSTEAAIADFEAALIRLSKEGRTEFGNADVHERMRFAWAGDKVSKRFTALTEDATLNPPGLVIERLGRGRFMLTRVAERPPAQ